MKLYLKFCSAVFVSALLLANPARAGLLTYEVNFNATSISICGGIAAPCFGGPVADTFVKVFQLDEALLAVDGDYDVASSLAPGFTTFVGGTSSLSALAKVAGGVVVDLLIDFSDTLTTNPAQFTTQTETVDFMSSGGLWSDRLGNSVSSIGLNVSGSETTRGNYVISQRTAIPEPASVLLVLLGLFFLAMATRERRI